jgi:DNA-binding CsgD family transcriptional regulator
MRLERVIPQLLELAAAAPDVRSFRRGALAHLARTIGCESAIYLSYPDDDRATDFNKGGFIHLHRRLLIDPRTYAAGLRKGRAATDTLGAYVDNDVYTAMERRNLPFYAEMIRPQGITSQLIGAVRFRGERIGTVHLCRHGRSERFRDRHTDELQSLSLALGVVQAAIEGTTRARANVLNDGGVLTAREREIARYVCRGLRNRDIGLLLGTSPATVRNQLQRMFVKLGVASRTELASLLLCGALE